MTSTDDTPTANGHDGSDREGRASTEDQAEDVEAKEEDVEATPSARNSVTPSATPSATITPAAPAAPPATTASPDATPVPVAAPKTEVSETVQAQSAPTTPVIPQPEFGSSMQVAQVQQSTPAQKVAHSGKRKRLPQDLVGQLEDRIAEDPRGDLDAWMSLISEHKRKGKFDDARIVYERFFVLFPQAVSLLSLSFPREDTRLIHYSQAEQWIGFVRMELDNNEFQRVEQVFSRSLLTVPNVELWSLYLDYIRRRNNLTNDPSGTARRTISQAYDFVLNNIGCDKEAGRIWQDQIAFVKSGPGIVGGSNWMDQQKMDSLRKIYQKAVTQPVIGVEAMWREYDGFEHGLNKITVRESSHAHNNRSFVHAQKLIP